MIKNKIRFFTSLVSGFLIVVFLLNCSSSSKSDIPDWAKEPSRVVDNGFIVYLGSSTASSAERAQIKAEGVALEDLANECSLIPKGTRVEDRYVTSERDSRSYDFTAYVKIAIELQDCDQARHTNDPAEIKKIANLPFTKQLKRYQDLIETGELPDASKSQEVPPPAEVAAMPAREAEWNDSVHLQVTRQYVAYQKEIVILSPADSYRPSSPESKKFVSAVAPASEQVLHIEEKQPALRAQSWSNSQPKLNNHALKPPTLTSKPVVKPAAAQIRPSTLSDHGHEGGAPSSFRKKRHTKHKRLDGGR